MLDTPTWKSFTANILSSTNTQALEADFTVAMESETLVFQNSKDMNEVKEIWFSISYNPENGKPENPVSSLENANISELQNEDGIASYIISFSSQIDIPTASTIMKLWFNTSWNSSTNYINIMNVNFKDVSWEVYLLSSSGTMF